jgi:hypothetical protein
VSETWALRLLRWSYCAFIAWASVRTFVEARAEHDFHPLVLSGVEIAAIAAFLFTPLETIACAVLLVVYAIAAVLTMAAHEDLPLRFVYFAMTAVYIVIAGQRRTVATNA